MPIKPKYELKGLFESGDRLSQSSMIDLIDSTYNPVLTAGANIQITNVETPSGRQTTISVKEVVTETGNTGIPTYADNAAAVSGGLGVGDIYKTTIGELRIVV